MGRDVTARRGSGGTGESVADVNTESVRIFLVGDGVEAENGSTSVRHVMVLGMERRKDNQRLYVSIPYDDALRFSLQVSATMKDMVARCSGGGWWGNPDKNDAASNN